MELSFGNELPKLDVLIVGAGLAGLTSGVKILAKEDSLNLKIIDECGSPGGQLGTQGLRFVNKEQTEMIDLMNQLNVTLRVREEAEGVQLERCWDLDRGLMSAAVKFELRRYIKMLDLRMKKFSSLRFQFRKRIPTMERHICSYLFFRRSRQFMFNLVELFSGVPPSQINFDEFMCLCSSCGGLSVIIDIYFEMPKSMMDVSCKQLLDALMEKLHVVEILKNVKVVKVKHFKDYVEVTTSLGKPYTAQAVILAMPWERVLELEFEPPLPKRYLKQTVHKEGPKKLLTQFYMRYNKSHWVYQGYSGNFLNVQPFVVGYENQPSEYCGYMMHSKDESVSVKETVYDLLREHFGEEMQSPLEYKEQTMELNTTLNKPQTRPWLRVIWAGSASGATRNRNLMGGAVESGIRAAVSALYVVRPQVVSWRDLQEVQDKKFYEGISLSNMTGFLSRVNLYNFTFYSVFVIGLVFLLNFGYSQSA
ncbi:hypothetical protein ACLKA7_010610 [Drosophila subpalustris]